MILFNKVTKSFGKKKVIDDISFKVKKGEIIGFLGPNGAGKTTTMRMALGILTPSSGDIKILNKDPYDNRLDVLAHIGYLPENNPLYNEMKVCEYLQVIAEIKKVKSNNDVASLAKDIGIDDVLSQKIETLSRGYRQRVGLAAALLGDPMILIFDEPTSGLDPIEQDKIKKLIKKVSKKKIVIFSTHILSEVEDIASRLIIIQKGSIIFDGKKPTKKGSVDKLFKKLVLSE